MTINLKTIKSIDELESILKTKTYDEIVSIVYCNIPLKKMLYTIPYQTKMMPIDFLKENLRRFYLNL